MTVPTPDAIRSLFDLSGRTAVVTGASSGIGRRIAGALAAAGAVTALVALDQEGLDETAQAIFDAGGRAATIAADLTDLEALPEIAAKAAKAFGGPDILVNAAGINLREPPEAVTPASWDRVVRTNLAAPFFLARALLDGLRASVDGGRIINIASLQSRLAFTNGLVYGATKGGVAQLTRAQAEAWSPHGVNANAIAPGFFPTKLTAPLFDDPPAAEALASRTLLGRNGRLEDLDGVAVFLAGRASAYVTGQVVFVDGGFTVH